MKAEDGTYRQSPPKNLQTLYAQSGPPEKLCLQGEINALKKQTQCCGVYALMPAKNGGDSKSPPVWKHATEDLQLCASKIKGDEGWVVCKFSTANAHMQVCMRISTPDGQMPYDKSTQGQWQEFDGRDWINAPSVKCRASWHGWGLDKLDRTRLKFSPAHAGGAY